MLNALSVLRDRRAAAPGRFRAISVWVSAPQYSWSWQFASRSSSASSAVTDGDQFWGRHFSAMSDGDVFYGTEIYTDRAPCAAQVSGCKIIGFSTVLGMAARSMLDVRIVRSHLFELRDSSFIMPNHLPHIAHYAMSPTASSDSRFAFAHYVQSEAAPALPMQQWCGVQPPMQRVMLRSLVSVGGEGIAAPCCGHREPLYTHRSRFACSMRVPLRRGRGVGVF